MRASVFSSRPSQAGFTLVEIAIVLVIIGLLLGGILKGQEMINQARIKNAINDFNGISVAVTSYQDRYRFLPGDDPNADTRWTVQAPAKATVTVSSEGNYNVIATAAAPTAAQESNLFWQHLRIAGFVPGITTGAGSGAQPMNAASGMVGVQTAVGATPAPQSAGLHGPDDMQLEHTGQGRDRRGRTDGRQ